MKQIGFFFIVALMCFQSVAQAPFHKGVNLTNWFQTNSAEQIQFTKYTKTDFQNIKSLGCDAIRLPINLHSMTSGSPNYTITPLFFDFLDEVVNWAEELQMYLIIDNHTFDPLGNTDPNVGTILTKVWTQMAAHYKNRSNYILYEVLNEPHGIADATWGQIQQTAINAIRAEDTKHTIIVGGSGFNSYNNLSSIPVYTDNNLLYTFHFYDPFVFTHQGATWVEPSMAPLAGVPFPYNASKMPTCPSSLVGSWICSGLNSYSTDGTEAKVKALINIALNFKTQRNVNIYCGEFGVYIPNSTNADRAYWYKVVGDYLTEKNIAWTIWDYHGGFGLFEKDSEGLFESDLNIAITQALGMSAPEQKEFVITPDTKGFTVYSDFIGEKISEASSPGNSTISYYNTSAPKAGKYAIKWTNPAQYNTIGFDFVPNKDLTTLVANNFFLEMWVKSSQTGAKLDIRFIDTKTGANDHPWRSRVTLGDAELVGDNQWHNLRIPLANFAESGSWDNNTWFDPEGKFDWKAIDRLEIVSEYANLSGYNFEFDKIEIWDGINSSIKYSIDKGKLNQAFFYPNPVTNNATIDYYIEKQSLINIEIFDMTGKKLAHVLNQNQDSGNHSIDLNINDINGFRLLNGSYICKITSNEYVQTIRFIVIN